MDGVPGPEVVPPGESWRGGRASGAALRSRDALDAARPIRSARPCQFTLRNPISCRGVGLHSGRTINLRLLPAPAGHGIVFRRTDLGITIPARFDHVIDTRLSTVLASLDDPGARISTVEHVMAALSGCGIDNACVEVDGPEIPALDGSAAHFVFLIDCAGLQEQSAARGAIEVLRRVRVEDGDAFAELRPSPSLGSSLGPCLSLSLSIDFPAHAIGSQAFSMSLTPDHFRRELSDCRTFALLDEIERLRQAGLARGGSLDNAIVVDGARVLNPAGLRHRDEFVRHKMLDAVGDLGLAGQPIRGAFIGHRSGHSLNNRLLRKLLGDTETWRIDGADAVERIAA